MAAVMQLGVCPFCIPGCYETPLLYYCIFLQTSWVMFGGFLTSFVRYCNYK